MIKLTIDGQVVQVEPGTTVLQAARQAGIKIPTLCHDERLSSPGACRLCVVEIEGMRNLPASCVTHATEGMVVHTHSPAVIEARKTILELLLANHPLDCLTCEKSGDCKLQDYCYEYEITNSGFEGERHTYELDESNPYIIRDNNKCILCGKCVRACAEIKGANVLEFTNRGFNTKVTTAFDLPFCDSDCVYCHNCVAVCPVGALLPKEMAGKGRRWEMEKEPVTCTFCEAGCEFFLYRKNGKVVGVVAKGAAPGRPLCLKGRLGLNFVHNPDCVDKPLLKVDGEFIPVDWAEALGLGPVFEKLKKVE
ncbi:2Fe-2S iron-sulfur cluster-binding protein [Zhaonella formicivorans]|uniref:2Fe-2S iron-sulfur cluster-binding protein n=1 Tax=Zhaonella formicivorans TaxID=2528593 RepID=UPI0010E9FBE5|nr:2Fe-2S iron-sulfur cluster-binding protein [Zhaonella formicivorans]